MEEEVKMQENLLKKENRLLKKNLALEILSSGQLYKDSRNL